MNNSIPKTLSLHNNQLKLLSWNIQSNKTLEGTLKASDPDFLKIISDKDFLCLQETREPLKIPGFVCYNKNRTSSKSGGVCIAVSRRLATKCVYIKNTGCEDIQAIRISNRVSPALQNKDVILINVYNSPSNSSYKRNNPDKDGVLHTLGQLISDLHKPNTALIIAGDLNARIGSLQEDENGLDMPTKYLESPIDQYANLVRRRTSKDSVTNSDGNTWLDILLANCMVVLNGRTIGDVTGDFTCLKYNGSSTIDYIAVSTALLSSIDEFWTLPLSNLSDHKPVSTRIKLSLTNVIAPGKEQSTITNSISPCPKSFKWDQPELFTQTQLDDGVMMKMSLLNELKLDTRDDVIKLSKDLIGIIQDVAGLSLSKKSGRRTNKNPWFDWDCRFSKRNLKRLCDKYTRMPCDATIREAYYVARKDHRRLLKSKKYTFIKALNFDIESGKRHIRWKEFKKLKAFHSDEEAFDIHDLFNFYLFFQKLYDNSDKATVDIPSVTKDTHNSHLQESDLDDCLNNPVTSEELDAAIKNLKNNKSVSCDLISNEMLKCSGSQLRSIILKLFNGCLDYGSYPWNESITTPLHKKGDKQNPDNYRAITIGSCLGKLFSSILLKRVIDFRKTHCPDTTNQLGFCEGAQTADHILTLSTLINKYTKVEKKRLYACFVDFRKAFDSVNREALLYKLGHIGLQGKFLKCIKDMYTKSNTRIKLIQKLSQKIDVLVGTEQGHPLSPEFFKVYIHELSEILDKCCGDYPVLWSVIVTHLLWADDLVLMALNPEDLNTLLKALHEFCTTWGLEVNLEKTKIMTFNRSGRLLKNPVVFKLGEQIVETTRSYCYLGIIFSLNGSFKVAQDELRKKALRSYFSMKKTIDVNSLSVKAVLKLFDSLVLPVLTYGIEVWFCNTQIAAILSGKSTFSIKLLSRDSFEKFHMQVIKWTLGVHKRASNIGCYGDTGRQPIGTKCIPQVLRYFTNLESLSASIDHLNMTEVPLAVLAFLEQQNLQMSWHNTLKDICNRHSLASGSHIMTIKKSCYNEFLLFWKVEKTTQNKLNFYSSVKSEFRYEEYLSLLPRNVRSHVTRLRISAHTLNIERGRYNTKTGGERLLKKACQFCMDGDVSNALLHELPFFNPIVEDELHALVTCPRYNIPRSKLPSDVLSLLLRHDTEEAFEMNNFAFHLGHFIRSIFEIRDFESRTRSNKKS